MQLVEEGCAGHEIFHSNLDKPCLDKVLFMHRGIVTLDQFWVSWWAISYISISIF